MTVVKVATKEIENACKVKQALKYMQGYVSRHDYRPKDGQDITIDFPGVGESVAQGNVRLMRLSGVPADATEVFDFPLKITKADTRGELHLWEHRNGLRAFQLRQAEPDRAETTPLRGLVYLLEAPNVLLHPDHGDHRFMLKPGETWCGVAEFQRDLSGERLRD